MCHLMFIQIYFRLECGNQRGVETHGIRWKHLYCTRLRAQETENPSDQPKQRLLSLTHRPLRCLSLNLSAYYRTLPKLTVILKEHYKLSTKDLHFATLSQSQHGPSHCF